MLMFLFMLVLIIIASIEVSRQPSRHDLLQDNVSRHADQEVSHPLTSVNLLDCEEVYHMSTFYWLGVEPRGLAYIVNNRE